MVIVRRNHVVDLPPWRVSVFYGYRPEVSIEPGEVHLWGASNLHGGRLPEKAEMIGQLKQSGYKGMVFSRLIPGDSFHAFLRPQMNGRTAPDDSSGPASPGGSTRPAAEKEVSVNTQIYINLPVADLPRSMAFFEALGFSRDPQVGDDTGGCIVVSDTIFVMLTTHARFRDFTPKAICDTGKAVEVLINLSCESREQVDDLVARALAAGGSTYDRPEDFGFMYTHSFVDPDGHGWGLFHMTATPAPE